MHIQTNGEALRHMEDTALALSLCMWLSEQMALEAVDTWQLWGDMLLWFASPAIDPAPPPAWMAARDGYGRE